MPYFCYFAALLLLSAPTVLTQLRLLFDPWTLNDDERINFVFYPYFNTDQFQNDYITQYVLAALTTPVWRALYFLGALTGFHLRTVADLISLSMWLLFLTLLGRIVWELSKKPAVVWTAIALAIASGLPFASIAGGFARSFGFPGMALAMLFFLKSSPLGLALTTVFGILSYPPIAAVSGSLLALLLFGGEPMEILTAGTTGDIKRRDLSKRLMLLGVTAFATLMLATLQIRSGQEFGRRVLSTSDAMEFPEAGPGGRNMSANLPPYPAFTRAALKSTQQTFFDFSAPNGFFNLLRSSMARQNVAKIFSWIFLTGAIAGLCLEPLRRQKVKLAAFLLVSLGLYSLSALCAPFLYEPERFVSYTVPLLSLVVLPVYLHLSFEALCRRFLPHCPGALLYCATIVLFLAVHGKGSSRPRPFSIVVPAGNQALYEAVAALPNDAKIAGWPSWAQPVCNIPYLSGKPVFLCAEYHYTFHLEYLKEMRARMTDLIRVYFSSRRSALTEFRDKYGLTHVIVNRKHFLTPETARYFKPFQQMITERLARRARNPVPPILATLIDSQAAVFEQGDFVLIDIRGLE